MNELRQKLSKFFFLQSAIILDVVLCKLRAVFSDIFDMLQTYIIELICRRCVVVHLRVWRMSHSTLCSNDYTASAL